MEKVSWFIPKIKLLKLKTKDPCLFLKWLLMVAADDALLLALLRMITFITVYSLFFLQFVLPVYRQRYIKSNWRVHGSGYCR